MASQYFEGIGRRKEGTARVRIMTGSGLLTVNGKPGNEYFTRFGDLENILTPFKATGQDPRTFDMTVVVKGGGVSGQTDSVQLGLARA